MCALDFCVYRYTVGGYLQMRGPRPKPVELRVLHGTAARIAAASVPKPRRNLPRCPEYFEGRAAELLEADGERACMMPGF